MDKSSPHIALKIAIVAALAVGLLTLVLQLLPAPSSQEKYTLYVGLNDEKTKQQLIDADEAVRIADEVCIKHVDGYTVTRGYGGWYDDEGNLWEQTTLLCTFIGIDESTARALADDLIKTMGIKLVLIEHETIQSQYCVNNGE